MKQSKIILFGLFSVFCWESAIAEVIDTQKAEKIVNIKEMNGNLINNGCTPQEIDRITDNLVKRLKIPIDKQSKKTVADAVCSINSGQGVIATEQQLEDARKALSEKDTSKAKALFSETVARALEQAKEAKQTELKSNQQAATALRHLGALAYLDNTQEALTAYRRATELDPNNADGWNQLGRSFYHVGDLNEAITAYNKVLALDEIHQDQKERAIALRNLGDVSFIRGELDKAKQNYQQSLSLDEAVGNKQGIAADYIDLGNISFTRGELDKAIEFYQQALTLGEALGNKQDMAAGYGNLGNVSYARGELDKAKQNYQQSIELLKYIGSPLVTTVQEWLDELS